MQAAQLAQEMFEPLGALSQRVMGGLQFCMLGRDRIALSHREIPLRLHRQHQRTQCRGLGGQVGRGRRGVRHAMTLCGRRRCGNPFWRLHTRPIQGRRTTPRT